MKKKQIIWLQIIYWSLNFFGTVITPLYFFGKETHLQSTVLRITFFLAGIITFYICYLVIIPKVFRQEKVYTVILSFFLSILCFATIRYLMEEVLLPATFGFRNYNQETGLLYYFFDNIYYGCINVFIAGIMWLLEKFGVIETERQKLEQERNEAKIQALKTQINPHFIFNTLNNIYSLIYQNSEKALPAIEELSQLLRYSTKDLEKNFIPLEKEIGYLESLIELEKLRIKNPELLLIEKKINHPNLNISPMLLVPFVENAFKHGDFSGKGFTLKISDNNQTLNFHLRNFKKQRSKDSLSGIGIGNVKKRLEILYPKKHELNIVETETEFSVDLTIDLK
ncbi:histidine kinase [Epilithonimonas ginsengisoli]|uniref:Histidine kinase n=1 Tax=Epilithonimonas ginsengisoli TaxID=1245592 RepID=A0ABU4JFZ7_9FLAO|nr:MULTISPECIES: histidine kinase [Chryseobacterium group]MBV6879235.1 histidine kinase [Epilithonimonas sp. FP105]MDW8548606.1 histidine kinase [Epilithonimonas ginsengisoli]OAH75481.1 histidine kinase [Chryseobacterium sp. FP211-J200]